MELHHLFVHRPLRGQGVGQALLTGAITLSRQLEAEFLMVAAEPGNARAHAFYERAGFQAHPNQATRFQRLL